MSKAPAKTRSSASSTHRRPAATPSEILIPRIALIAFVAALVLFGLVMLYSSSSVYSYYIHGDSSAEFVRQLTFVILGVGGCIVAALIPYGVIVDKFAKPLWVLTTVLLIATLISGITGLGAQRWIDIGFMNLQPSELAKIAIMVVLVQLVDKLHERGASRALYIMMGIAVLVPIVLIILEPDLGTTIIALVGVLAVLWFGGVPMRIILGIVALAVAGALVMVLSESFRQDRLSSFLAPWDDPLGKGYQILNSYYAFGDGGLFGVGIGLSRQKFNYLPEAQNDFIFAIVGEELGLLGALAVVALFIGFLYAAFNIAKNAPDRRGTMLAGAAAVLIGFQALLNIACVVGLVPVTGKPLPFFSAGGTSMISSMVLVGLILSVSLQSKQLSVHEQRREQLLIINGGAGRYQENPGEKPERKPERKPAKPSLPLRLPQVATSALEKVIPISRARALQSVKKRPEQSRGSSPLTHEETGLSNTGSRSRKAAPDTRQKLPSASRQSGITTEQRPSRQAQPALSMAALRKNRTGLAERHTKIVDLPQAKEPKRRRTV